MIKAKNIENLETKIKRMNISIGKCSEKVE